VNFVAITLCVASQRVFIIVSMYFIIDSVRKLLDTPLYFVKTYGLLFQHVLMLSSLINFQLKYGFLQNFVR